MSAKLIRTEEFYKGKKKYFFECEKCGGEFWSWVHRENTRPICGNCARERDKFKAKVNKLLKEKEIYKKGYEAGLMMAEGFKRGIDMINIKENNNNFEQHQKILDKIHETYIQKNNAYGNSFDESCDDFGVTAAVVRLSDKFNRLKTLTKNPDIPTGDESVMDTLLDMANYAILTYMWLENQQKKDYEPVTKKLVPINIEKYCKNCKYVGVSACDKPCLTCVEYDNWEPINGCEGCIYDGGTFCNKSPENPCFEHDGYTPKEDK